jgi:transposase InsO family protein
VLEVARSGYYARLAGASGRTACSLQEERLVKQIRQIHTDTHATYGSPRITVKLRALGEGVNHKRVERLMRAHEIIGVHLRLRHRTTHRDPAAQAAPDLLERNFTAPGPDRRWFEDITYLRVADRFLYLATVLDLHSRRLIGWSVGEHARRTVDAFAARLPDQIDLDALHSELLAVVDQTMQPTQLSMWLRPPVSPRLNSWAHRP